jgi:hypothetical protein
MTKGRGMKRGMSAATGVWVSVVALFRKPSAPSSFCPFSGLFGATTSKGQQLGIPVFRL